jgi:hypothetical protein
MISPRPSPVDWNTTELGAISSFEPVAEQQQQFVPSIDLNVSPDWKINFGVGWGVTRSTDHVIIEAIIARRFSSKKKTS